MRSVFAIVILAVLGSADSTSGQSAQTPAPAAPRIVRISPTEVGIGSLRVNTAAKEVRAPGQINQVSTLEFIANTPRGLKEYESAITIDTTAVALNTALLLLGLDPSRARVPDYHLDPVPPKGDPVELFVEWKAASGVRRVKVEELVWNEVTRTTMPEGPWVYTGSRLADRQLLADADGVLVGFVHSPAPLIENPRPVPAKAYGELVLNPKLELVPGTPVTLIVRVLDRTTKTP
jgi:hypothetical protein